MSVKGLTHWPLGDFNLILGRVGNFQANFSEWWLRYLLWNCPQMNATRVDLTDDKSTLVQVMAWCCQVTSHILSQCWPRCMSPNGVTRPQWLKFRIGSNCQLIISNFIEFTLLKTSKLLLPQMVVHGVINFCQHWFTELQVMVCCLAVSSHYLNQRWHTISKVPWLLSS